MNSKSICLLSGIFVLSLLLMACDKTQKNINDSTLPKAEIKIKNADNQYVTAPEEIKLGFYESINLRCVATDDDGIRSVATDFSHTVSFCSVNMGLSGSFPLIGMPANDVLELSADGDGNVLKFLQFPNIVAGPFSCDASPNGQGHPFGETVAVVCTARNWNSDYSNSTAKSILKIKLH